MQIDRDTIESNLSDKGFVREDSHHRFFYHECNGRRTGAYTYTSHGSKYKTYSEPLFRMMKKQLRLDRIKQVEELFLCPMDGDEYIQILKGKGLLER
jgi:hypothetical protein